MRKDHGFDITDHICVVVSPEEQTDAAIAAYADYIKSQVLAEEINIAENSGEEVAFDEFTLNISISKN